MNVSKSAMDKWVRQLKKNVRALITMQRLYRQIT